MSEPSDEGETTGEATWLTRLLAEEWLAAATGELTRADEALRHKQQRAGVTQARRAAGMAWNAVLHGITDPAVRARYGRSYMEHLRALENDETCATPVRDAAHALVHAPFEQVLVQLGAGDTRLARCAETILEEAKRRLSGSGRS